MGGEHAYTSKIKSQAKINLEANLLAMGFVEMENKATKKLFFSVFFNFVHKQFWD